jgi:hypothetical protein
VPELKNRDITEFAGSVQSYINRKPVSAMCNKELGYACGDERKVSKWGKMIVW